MRLDFYSILVFDVLGTVVACSSWGCPGGQTQSKCKRKQMREGQRRELSVIMATDVLKLFWQYMFGALIFHCSQGVFPPPAYSLKPLLLFLSSLYFGQTAKSVIALFDISSLSQSSEGGCTVLQTQCVLQLHYKYLSCLLFKFITISHLWYLPQSSSKSDSTKDKSKDKKRKSVPELVQDAPIRRILGSVHIPLQSLVKRSQKVNILCDFGALHKESEVEATQALKKASSHATQVFTHILVR